MFLSESRYASADFMLCLTPNGKVRWKMHLECVPHMIVTGVSNIVTNQEDGTLFFTSSWGDTGSYAAKVCRVYYPQTSHPAQECVLNYQVFSQISSSLSLNTKLDLLMTTVNNVAPVALNASTFEVLWTDRETMGADSDYKNDPLTGDIYWIGGDDDMRKFNSTGYRLLQGSTNSRGNRQFALDSSRGIIVRAWQDLSQRQWPLRVSAWKVSGTELLEHWQWKKDDTNSTNDDCTPPIVDDGYGLTYFATLPLALALDTNTGRTKWQTEIVTQSEIDRLNLVSTCLAFNEETRIIYVLVGSTINNFPTLFIVALHADTGKILKRIDLLKNLTNYKEEKKIITPHCPILIGNEMLYVSWLTGTYPDIVPLTIVGVPQIS